MADTPEQTQTATKEVQATGITSFGFGQIGKPTPMWVNWIFRTEFVLNKAFLMWIASTTVIAVIHLRETILDASIIDFAVWGLGRFVGITKDQMDK